MMDFSLWIECENYSELENLKEYFQDFTHTLLSGREIHFGAGIDSISKPPGLSVGSMQICEKGRGIENLKDALETTETGIMLYSKLKSAPDFKYAHIGWLAENYRDTSYLFDYVKDGSDGEKHWSGFECVINEKLYQELGSPVPFWQFREGYWWQKYRGEQYNPLWSEDQEDLRSLCEQLLPDNFDYSNSMR